MSAPLLERFRAHLDESGLLVGPGLALLAVSGGADSLALLDLVATVAGARGLTLLVVHADHGIGAASGEVAGRLGRIVRARYGLETVTERLGLGPEAGETRARTARFAFFRRVQADRDARWLVTAHHADDQVETVLLRLLRGSAPAGLAGIAPAGPGGLVRPLLAFRHADLVAHVHALGLEVHDDPANADLRHTRAWVRRALLPLMRERLGDEAEQSLLSVSRHARAEVAAWDAVLSALPDLALHASDGHFDVARAPLRGYDSPLAARLLRAAARRAGFMIAPAQAQRVVAFQGDAASGRAIDLGEGLVAEIAFDRLVVRRAAVGAPLVGALVGDSGAQQFGSFALNWRPEPAPGHLDREGWTTWIEPGALEVRLPAPGSRIVPLRGNGHRAVSKLLMEERVPRGERAGWPVVMRNGEPVWIPGVCRGDAAIPEPGTLAVRLDVAAAR